MTGSDAPFSPAAAPMHAASDSAAKDATLGHVLISSVRDEGPYVLEFVAHHRAIGFDLICIASNDCTDGTDLILGALARVGAIRHLPNIVPPGEAPQHVAYVEMRERFGLDKADWLMVLDADEFLSVDRGAGRVQDMTAVATPDDDIIMLSPLTFGTTADPMWQPGLVTEQFQRRLIPNHPANTPVKSIARDIGRFAAIHNHSVAKYRGTEPLTVLRTDGSRFQIPPGVAMWRHLRNIPRADIRHGFAHYNHYAIRSLACFILRQSRSLGTARLGEPNDRHTLAYFDRIARAAVTDTRFTDRYGTALRAERDRLLALPGVAAAQAEAERRFRARAAALI